jgi:hypothetical protein
MTKTTEVLTFLNLTDSELKAFEHNNVNVSTQDKRIINASMQLINVAIADISDAKIEEFFTQFNQSVEKFFKKNTEKVYIRLK